MYQIDVATASPTLPAPAAAGTPGYFTDGQVPNVPPTVVPADFMNAIMLEMLNVLVAAGITPSKTADNQLATAIRTIIEATAGNYAVDTGSANAYVVALTPPVTNYTESFSFSFRAVHANTGACQVNFGPGNVPLTRDDGSPLQQGDVLANSVVSGAFDPAVGRAMISSIVPSQLGALAKENIGLGLKDDGSGNLTIKTAGDGSLRLTAGGLQGNEPITYVAVNGSVAASSHFANFVATASVSQNLAQTTSLWNGFCFTYSASGGAVTLVPNAADVFIGPNGAQAAGQSYTLLKGQSALFVGDGAGNWVVLFQTQPANFSPAPVTISASQAIGVGVYNIDTSSGPVLLTLTASPGQGGEIVLIDPCGTWGTNPVTLNPNGNSIHGSTSTYTLNGPGETRGLIFKNTNWSLN